MLRFELLYFIVNGCRHFSRTLSRAFEMGLKYISMAIIYVISEQYGGTLFAIIMAPYHASGCTVVFVPLLQKIHLLTMKPQRTEIYKILHVHDVHERVIYRSLSSAKDRHGFG